MRYHMLAALYRVLDVPSRFGLLPRALETYHTRLALRLDLWPLN